MWFTQELVLVYRQHQQAGKIRRRPLEEYLDGSKAEGRSKRSRSDGDSCGLQADSRGAEALASGTESPSPIDNPGTNGVLHHRQAEDSFDV